MQQHALFARLAPWLLFPLYTAGLLLTFQLTIPILQPESYHDFADQRPFLGIPNFADVVSNLAILIPALLGCILALRSDAHTHFSSEFERVLASLFFITLTATAFGSTWYHLAPDHHRLLFDRLPIGLAFTTMIAWLIAERTWLRASGFLAMTPWILTGPACVLWWYYIAPAPGLGDLRPYLALYVVIFLVSPLLLLLPSSYSHAKSWWLVYLFFALGMAGDALDDAVFNALNGLISGHTLKHVMMGIALGVLVRMLARRRLRFR